MLKKIYEILLKRGELSAELLYYKIKLGNTIQT